MGKAIVKLMRKLLLLGILIALLIASVLLLINSLNLHSPYERKCYKGINEKLEEMKTKLEIVAEGGSDQSINFTMPLYCFDPKKETISLKTYKDPAICAEYCGAIYNECMLLTYNFSGENAFSYKKCLNINPNTNFPNQLSYRCMGGIDRRIINLTTEFPQGEYYLINGTEIDDPVPIVCAYKKEKALAPEIYEDKSNLIDEWDYCESDKDCGPGGSCCHPQQCQNTQNFIKWNEENCKNIPCTLECRPCPVCKCISNVCQQIDVKGVEEGGCC
jgi:hypothetical protein